MKFWPRRDRPDRPLLEQMRDLLARKPQTARVIYAKADGRERLTMTVRVLRSVLRRSA